ncbi:MAG: beta-glucosidase, partial [Bacteroidales bacterium]|nr:beta-glucosidase [Bacteroidales bacterium]
MNRFLIIALIVITFFTACKDSGKKDPASRVERIPFVEELLSRMTLEEKVGQMAQITLDVITIGEDETVSDEPVALDMDLVRWAVAEYGVGSVLNTANNRARTREKWHTIVSQIQEVALNETRLGIPVLYGIDAIHGTTYTAGATFFPQQIGQAATFNPDLVRKAAEITAYETRASAIPWTFSPVLDMGRDPRFPRMWETFGEDVYLTKVLGVEMIKGYEGEDNDVSDPFRIASCAKHYLGYSVPVSGKDRTPALI